MNTFAERVKGLVSRVTGGQPGYEDVEIAGESRSYRMRGYRGDHITRILQTGTFYESELLKEILRRYGKGGVYMDLGAFIGNHTIYFAKECAADAVIAVEPFKPSYDLLVHNISVNDASQVKTFNVGVGNVASTGRLSSPNKNRGMTTLASDAGGDVTIVRADDLVESPPKLIKIDTEGWAMQVLAGLEQTLRVHHPVLAIETHPEPAGPFEEFLGRFGYKLKGKFNFTPTYLFE